MEVVVIGGSIAGLCCAHSLLHYHRRDDCSAELRVLVLEKARFLTSAGAGLGIDSPSFAALHSWGISLLHDALPLSYEENRLIWQKKACTVAKDQDYAHISAHWSDLHRLLYDALPSKMVCWGHEVTSFEQLENGRRVKVYARLLDSSVREFEADLLIAADGSMSETCKRLVPHAKRRYCGYSAWRGVLDSTSEAGGKLRALLQQQYPDLGRCLYFDIAQGTHAVLYELTQGRLNWLWYVNQPEPILQGASVTTKADDQLVTKMHEDAERIWTPELASIMQATPSPFINAIFDRDPLEQLVWGHVVLVGEAAHPTSPHGLRSTNMSIQDADVLGKCIFKWGIMHLDEALQEYQCLRLPITSQQVLFSRHLGKIKQGFLSVELSLSQEGTEQYHILLQRNMRRSGN